MAASQHRQRPLGPADSSLPTHPPQRCRGPRGKLFPDPSPPERPPPPLPRAAAQTLALHETRVRPFAVDKLLAANPELEVQGVPPTAKPPAAHL